MGFTTTARMFAVGMVWSWVIAGMTEESLKLVPLLVLAVAGPPALAAGKVKPGAGISSRQASAVSELRNRRRALLTAGEAYSAASTDLAVTSVSESGSTVTVNATETTVLTYAKIRGDEPPDTRFAVPHVFTFQRSTAGAWELVAERRADDGVRAINEPSTASAVTQSVRPSAHKPAGAASTTKPKKQLGKQKSADNPPPAGAPAAGYRAMAGYNYTAMATYAERYWSNYNTSYRTFADTGGDCTNFISQALRAGGWADKSGLYTDYHYWWYNSLNQTRSWVNVNYWASFALSSGRTTNLSNVYQLGIGDILQMDFQNNASKDHSMITTYRSSSGVPYLTYHTTNTYRRSIASLVSAYPSATYYAFRT